MYDNLREKIQLVEEEFYMYSFFFFTTFYSRFFKLDFKRFLHLEL